MKKKLLILLFTIGLITNAYAGTKDSDVPTNAVLISQSSDIGSVYITVVNLDNNELVIIIYDTKGKLKRVKETGIIIDMNQQRFIIGKDAPFTN